MSLKPTTPQQLFTEEEYETFRVLLRKAMSVIPAFKDQVEWENFRYRNDLHSFSNEYNTPGIRRIDADHIILTEYDHEDGEFSDGLKIPKEAFLFPAEYEVKIKRLLGDKTAADNKRNKEWRRQQYENLKKEFEGG